jgi:hypothetical protein
MHNEEAHEKEIATIGLGGLNPGKEEWIWCHQERLQQ